MDTPAFQEHFYYADNDFSGTLCMGELPAFMDCDCANGEGMQILEYYGDGECLERDEAVLARNDKKNGTGMWGEDDDDDETEEQWRERLHTQIDDSANAIVDIIDDLRNTTD